MIITFLPIIIYLVVILSILASAVLAFIIQKNWATIMLLVSAGTLALLILAGIFFSFGAPQYSGLDIDLIMQILGFVMVPLYIMGLIGFMRSSASIYSDADNLSLENHRLATKLNQLNQLNEHNQL